VPRVAFEIVSPVINDLHIAYSWFLICKCTVCLKAWKKCGQFRELFRFKEKSQRTHYYDFVKCILMKNHGRPQERGIQSNRVRKSVGHPNKLCAFAFRWNTELVFEVVKYICLCSQFLQSCGNLKTEQTFKQSRQMNNSSFAAIRRYNAVLNWVYWCVTPRMVMLD
jgi:hypothetical protein